MEKHLVNIDKLVLNGAGQRILGSMSGQLSMIVQKDVMPELDLIRLITEDLKLLFREWIGSTITEQTQSSKMFYRDLILGSLWKKSLGYGYQSGSCFFWYFSFPLSLFSFLYCRRPNNTEDLERYNNEGPFSTGLKNWNETVSIFQLFRRNQVNEAELGLFWALIISEQLTVQTNSGFADLGERELTETP